MSDIADKGPRERLPYFLEKYGMELDTEFCKFIAGYVTNVNEFPIGSIDNITEREEANALTAYCFRNTAIGNFHTDRIPIDEKTMKELMIESSKRLANWLKLKQLLQKNKDGRLYNLILRVYEATWTSNWEK